MLKRYLRQSATLMAINGLDMVSNLILASLLARFGGASLLAEYSLALVSFMLCWHLALIGLPDLLMREAAQRPSAIGALALGAFGINGIVAAVVCGLVGIIPTSVLTLEAAGGEHLRGNLLLVLAGLAPVLWLDSIQWISVGRGSYRLIVVVRFTEVLCRSTLMILLILRGSSVQQVLLVFVGAKWVFGLLAAGLMLIRFRPGALPDVMRLWMVLRHSVLGCWTVHIWSALMLRLDMILLWIVGSTQAYPLATIGAFDAARRIFNACFVLSECLYVSQYRDAARTATHESHQFPTVLGTIFTKALSILVPGSVTLIFLSDPIIPWLFGRSGFESSILVLPILAVAILPMGGVYFLTRILIAQNRVLRASWIMGIGVVVYVFVGVPLIGQHGGTGVAVALLVASTLVVAIQAWTVKMALPRARTVLRWTVAVGLQALFLSQTSWLLAPLRAMVGMSIFWLALYGERCVPAWWLRSSPGVSPESSGALAEQHANAMEVSGDH